MAQDWTKKLSELASQGTCSKKQVGCFIVKDEEILIEAANGRPGDEQCLTGNCERCAAADLFPRGRDHDICSCLHAEQRAITGAARDGIQLKGARLFSSYQPCLTCLKLSVASGIVAIRYIEPWVVPDVENLPNLKKDYESLEALLPEGSIPII